MNELSPALRRIVDAGAAALEPRSGDRERLRGRILAAAGAGLGTSLLGDAAVAGSVTKTGGLGGVKVTLALVAAGALAGGAIAFERALRDEHPASRPVVVEPGESEAPRAAPMPDATIQPRDVAPVQLPPLEREAAATGKDAPPPPRAPSISRKAPAQVEPSVQAPGPVDTLTVEMRLLRTARRALAAGEPGAAVDALAEHQRRFPNGELAPEAAQVRVEALCAAGRTDDARAAAAALAERWPALPAAPTCWKGAPR